jgi:hypothetical protein
MEAKTAEAKVALEILDDLERNGELGTGSDPSEELASSRDFLR